MGKGRKKSKSKSSEGSETAKSQSSGSIPDDVTPAPVEGGANSWDVEVPQTEIKTSKKGNAWSDEVLEEEREVEEAAVQRDHNKRRSYSSYKDREDRSSKTYESKTDGYKKRSSRDDRPPRTQDFKDNSRTQDWRDDRSSRSNESRENNSRRTQDWRDDPPRSNTYRENNSKTFESRRSEPFRGNKRDEERSDKRFSLNENDARKPRDGSNSRRGYKSKDPEFFAYKDEFSATNGRIEYKKVQEVTSDLFEASEDYSLAHCVAEDMNMGSGIAVLFRRKFKNVAELLNQRQVAGGLAFLKDKVRYVYYLVTKTVSTGKPTYQTLFSSLKCLRNHVIENHVEKIAMPRIGCGLDRLEWTNVKFMLEFIFKEIEIEIVVCNLEPAEDSTPQRHKNCKVTHEKYGIEKIDKETVILYFSSEDEYISDEMKNLDEKFHFLSEYKYAKKSKGNVIFYTRNKEYLLCGCIVRKSRNEKFDFIEFQKCLSQIQKENKKCSFYYYAFQAFKDEDQCINYKIINILRNSLREVEVYVCWPGDLMTEMTPRDRFGDEKDAGSKWDEGKKNDFHSNRNSREGGYKNDNWRQKKDNYDRSWASEKESTVAKKEEFVEMSGSFCTNWEDPAGPKTDYAKPQETYLNDSVETEDNTTNSDWFQSEGQNPSDDTLNSSVEDSFETSHQNNTAELPKTPKPDVNHQYESFKLDYESGNIDSSRIKEQKTPNFPKQYSRVCFVKEDFTIFGGIPLGSDIAPLLGKLLNQKQKEGDLAYTKDGPNSFLYCLIISGARTSPTALSIFRAIQKLEHHVTRNSVRAVELPIIKSIQGDFEIKWHEIKAMFAFIFGKHQIEMFGSIYEPNYIDFLMNKKTLKLVHKRSGIHQAPKKSVIIYIASADDQFTEEMNNLSKKFEFSDEFKKLRKNPGDVIKYKENEDNVLYGCVVRRRMNDVIDFEELRKCLLQVYELNNTEKLNAVWIQAVKDPDESTNYKIITTFIHNSKEMNINICWPGDLRSLIPQK